MNVSVELPVWLPIFIATLSLLVSIVLAIREFSKDKRRLKAIFGFEVHYDDTLQRWREALHITITNSGTRPLHVDKIFLRDDQDREYLFDLISPNTPAILHEQERLDCYMYIEWIREELLVRQKDYVATSIHYVDIKVQLDRVTVLDVQGTMHEFRIRRQILHLLRKKVNMMPFISQPYSIGTICSVSECEAEAAYIVLAFNEQRDGDVSIMQDSSCRFICEGHMIENEEGSRGDHRSREKTIYPFTHQYRGVGFTKYLPIEFATKR